MQFEQAGQFIIQKLSNELPDYLTYHNAAHTRDVVAAAKRIGEMENISVSDMNLLLTAAWYHDSGYLMQIKEHEAESCRIAQQVLPGFKYTPHQIDIVCEIIKATRLPQSPTNDLGQILADADLDYLGREDFTPISHSLFTELSKLGLIGNEKEWDETQVIFLENHHYFTQTAVNLRQALKAANLQQIKARLTNNATA